MVLSVKTIVRNHDSSTRESHRSLPDVSRWDLLFNDFRSTLVMSRSNDTRFSMRHGDRRGTLNRGLLSRLHGSSSPTNAVLYADRRTSSHLWHVSFIETLDRCFLRRGCQSIIKFERSVPQNMQRTECRARVNVARGVVYTQISTEISDSTIGR